MKDFFFITITKENGYKLSEASDWDKSEITNRKTPNRKLRNEKGKPSCPPELKQKT